LFTTDASYCRGPDSRRIFAPSCLVAAIPHDRVDASGSSFFDPEGSHRHGFVLGDRTKSTIGGVWIAPEPVAAQSA